MTGRKALCAVMTLCISSFLFSQQELPRVRVFPFNTPSGDPGIESLSQTAVDTLVLTLQLLGKYRIERGERPSPLDSDEVFETLRQDFVDYAVYGAIQPDPETGYKIVAYSWDSATDAVTLGVEMQAASAFDLFESIDLATVRFAEDFTGIHIGFGRLVFENRSPEESYLVEIDGNPVGVDVPHRDVLYGQRRVSILIPAADGVSAAGHLVSYVLNVEEGEEYTVPFSVDPEIYRSGWGSGVEAPVALEGSIALTSHPRSAEVRAGDDLLGRTPLLVDPLFLTPGEDLRIERAHFLPAEELFEGSGIFFDLEIDPADPAVNPALNRVLLGSAANILITSAQVLFVMLPMMEENGADEGPPAWPLMLAASPRFGYALGGDMKRAAVSSLISMAGAGLILGAAEYGYMDSDLGMILWQVPFWSTILYDLTVPPFYAAAENRETLRRIKREGLPEIEERRHPWLGRLYAAAQIGGGAWFMGGGGIDLLRDFLSLNIYAGISGDYFEPFKPIPAVTAKAQIFPVTGFDMPLQPYAAAVLHMAMKVDNTLISGAAGPALGLEVPADLPWLPPLTLFFEAEYYYSPVGAFPMIGFGAKIK
jgi:hypothetical protein